MKNEQIQIITLIILHIKTLTVSFLEVIANFFKIIESINFPKSFKWTQKLYHYFHNDLYFNLKILS